MRLISWVTLNADVGIARSGLRRLADYATGRQVAALNGPTRVERADLLYRHAQQVRGDRERPVIPGSEMRQILVEILVRGDVAEDQPPTPAPLAICPHTLGLAWRSVAAPADANPLWAELMRRSLGLDVRACPRCGGRLTLIALIDDPAVIVRVLRHLGRPTDIPEAAAV